MREYRGMGNGRVTIDGDILIVKFGPLKERCTFIEVASVTWKEPTILFNGSLIIKTEISRIPIVFTRKRKEQFRELYNFLVDKLEELRPEREKRQRERKERVTQMNEAGTPYCFKCLSTSLFPEEVNMARLGPLVHLTCLKCGYRFQPRRTF